MQLAQLYELLDDEGRKALAARVDIKPAYLWQIATHWKGKRPSVDLISKLVQADARLTAAELVDEFSGSGPTGPVGTAALVLHGLASPVPGAA